MTHALRTAIFLTGLVLVCGPVIIYGADSLVGLGRLDPLTLSTLTGALGSGLMALSQGDRWARFFTALLIGLLLVGLQVYGIAFLVLSTSEL